MATTTDANVTSRTTHPEVIEMNSQSSTTWMKIAEDLMATVVGRTLSDRIAPQAAINPGLRSIVKKAGFSNYTDKTTGIVPVAVNLDLLERTITLTVTLVNTNKLPRAGRTEVVTTRATVILNFRG